MKICATLSSPIAGLTRGNKDPGSTVRIMITIPHRIPGILFLVSRSKRLTDLGFVSGVIKEAVKLGDVVHFDLDDPSFTIGVAVDEFGILFVSKGFVDFEDFASDGHEQFGGSLHSFDGAKFFLSFKGFANDVGVNINESDVAKFVLCVIGNADVGFFAFKADPFVVVGVLQI